MTNSAEDFVTDKRNVQALIYAIVNQAIADWKLLCGTGPYCKETPSKNFGELDEFFKVDCPKMIGQETTNKIYRELLKIRKRRFG